ncbi:MAG: diaminopimelate decarboxylase [Neisseriaceae bacterium]|nr:diaminopimelate decarboxylase [Neisseriaceae bacterium]MBP6862996.1 diaminopimelate decarboxylase [Neisseriaceae bacterium]
MSALTYQNQTLHFEDVALNDLAKEHGTPLYVYSQNELTKAYHNYEQAFAKLTPLICYAVKANGNLSVLKHFASLGSGFDIVSGGELARVLAAGGDAAKTIFSGVGKSAAEIEYALQQGVLCFNVESINELERINDVAKKMGQKAPISLRINPDVDAKTHPYISTGLKANKFGIAFKDAIKAYQHAASLPYLNIVGIDCHIGSQLTDLSPLVEAFERLLVLVDQLTELGIHLSHVDIGGGVGIVYHDEPTPDLNQYADAVHKRLGQRDLKIMMEPGRSLVGNAGVLLTKVEFIKAGEEKNFIIVDAAMNDLLRPSLYAAYHEIVAVNRHDDVKAIVADVVGPICETGDFLGQNRELAVKEGELLAIKSAGAYASSMASNYNARMRAAEVMVNGKDVKVVRQRETIAQLLANEQVCLD